MSGHTKGPWGIHPVCAYVVPADHMSRPIGGATDPAFDLATYAQEICAMRLPDPHRPEAETFANARLIAAAPDLLEALKATRALVSEAAAAGFNWQDGDWTDRLFANQASITAALRRASAAEGAR